MNMLGPSIPLALFLSCFPAVFGTVGIMFLFQFVFSVPYARARKQILQENESEFLTNEVIERELARRYPRLYTYHLYSPFIMLLSLAVIYLVTFVLIVAIGLRIIRQLGYTESQTAHSSVQLNPREDQIH